MNIYIKKNLKQILVNFVIVFMLINSIGFAQKKKPSRTSTIPQDTTITIQEKPEPVQATDPGLPTIELKEHTIIGERIITNVPVSKKTTDKTNVPIITANPTGEGKGNRLLSGAGGMKMDQTIFLHGRGWSIYGDSQCRCWVPCY